MCPFSCFNGTTRNRGEIDASTMLEDSSGPENRQEFVTKQPEIYFPRALKNLILNCLADDPAARCTMVSWKV